MTITIPIADLIYGTIIGAALLLSLIALIAIAKARHASATAAAAMLQAKHSLALAQAGLMGLRALGVNVACQCPECAADEDDVLEDFEPVGRAN